MTFLIPSFSLVCYILAFHLGERVSEDSIFSRAMNWIGFICTLLIVVCVLALIGRAHSAFNYFGALYMAGYWGAGLLLLFMPIILGLPFFGFMAGFDAKIGTPPVFVRSLPQSGTALCSCSNTSRRTQWLSR